MIENYPNGPLLWDKSRLFLTCGLCVVWFKMLVPHNNITTLFNFISKLSNAYAIFMYQTSIVVFV